MSSAWVRCTHAFAGRGLEQLRARGGHTSTSTLGAEALTPAPRPRGLGQAADQDRVDPPGCTWAGLLLDAIIRRRRPHRRADRDARTGSARNADGPGTPPARLPD